jgi:hypothetical protein
MRLSTRPTTVSNASRILGAVIAVIAVSWFVTGAGGAGGRSGGAGGPRRIDDLRLLGTHNSYHLRPDRTITPGEPADYAHAPLDVQLSQQGVRSVEIDAYNAPTFPVFHSLIVDTGSTCPTLSACLGVVEGWSATHPEHEPLVVFFEPKRLPTNTNPAVQAAIDASAAEQGITGWDAAGLDRVDDLVRDTFGDDLITPDEVRGKRASLRAAVRHDGWPTLSKSRGRVLVVLIGDRIERDLYVASAPSLEGRAMFVNARPSDPAAAVISRDDADPAAVRALVRQHFLVKTRADANGVEARANDHSRAARALASGAQVVVTDYPVPDPAIGQYSVQLDQFG